MKIIRAVIDAKGNVHVDFLGYAGEECAAAEEAFRRALAEFGLAINVLSLQRKDPGPMAAELRPHNPPTHRAQSNLHG